MICLSTWSQLLPLHDRKKYLFMSQRKLNLRCESGAISLPKSQWLMELNEKVHMDGAILEETMGGKLSAIPTSVKVRREWYTSN